MRTLASDTSAARNAAITEIRLDPYEVIDAFFEQFGSCILRGCEVNGKSVTPGIVALAGIDHGRRIFRVVRFAGARGVTRFPVFLTLRKRIGGEVHGEETGFAPRTPPGSGHYYYEAVLTTGIPDVPSLKIEQEGGREFVEAIQDEEHCFVSAHERVRWNRGISRHMGETITSRAPEQQCGVMDGPVFALDF